MIPRIILYSIAAILLTSCGQLDWIKTRNQTDMDIQTIKAYEGIIYDLEADITTLTEIVTRLESAEPTLSDGDRLSLSQAKDDINNAERSISFYKASREALIEKVEAIQKIILRERMEYESRNSNLI